MRDLRRYLSGIPAGALREDKPLRDALYMEVLTDIRPSLAVVDRGYRGHGVTRTRVLISGTRKGITPMLAKLLRMRSAIEAEIGHMKTDSRLIRCPLKGSAGDALFAVLCACGHNIRKILTHLRAIFVFIIAALSADISHRPTNPIAPQTA
jgi:transposase, IS5 family